MRAVCLIEGSLYTSEGLLLFRIVNTTVTLIFSFCLLSLSLSYSGFPHTFSASVKSTAIILNQDVFTDFLTLALCYHVQLEKHYWESGIITLCMFVCLCGVKEIEGHCSGCVSVNLVPLCGTLTLLYKGYFIFCCCVFPLYCSHLLSSLLSPLYSIISFILHSEQSHS